MAVFLVLYATGEGQTEKVATRIAEALRERGHEATLADAAKVPADLVLDDVDAVLVGASIHVGKHQPEARRFVEANRDGFCGRAPVLLWTYSSSVFRTHELLPLHESARL